MTEVVATFQREIAAMMADPESPMRRFLRAAAQVQAEMKVVTNDVLAEEGGERVGPES